MPGTDDRGEPGSDDQFELCLRNSSHSPLYRPSVWLAIVAPQPTLVEAGLIPHWHRPIKIEIALHVCIVEAGVVRIRLYVDYLSDRIVRAPPA